jgi:FHA domain-containing protein
MIAIRVVSRAGEPLGLALHAEFGDAGGDIGRGSDCTLVLPDPQRRISRKHVQLTQREGRPFIRLMSTNLPVELDDMPLSPGIEYPLHPGATFRIGPYVLQVESVQAPVADVMADVMAAAPVAHLRPSVFHDVLQSMAPPPNGVGEIDLVVGDSSGVHTAEAAADPLGALYAGLDLAPADGRAATPQQVRLIGALLHVAVAGTLRLLAARSAAKRELGADRTLPRAGENNPLKFSPDVHSALRHLLGPPGHGFVPPLQAMQEAFDDLEAHELSILAGMRGALEAVMARLDPQALESRLSKGRWGHLLPVNRKARLWERYAEMHAELMREIEDDVDDLVRRAFLEAYEAQLARLSRHGAQRGAGDA